ncbi:hypothetical protein D3C75_311410 [compost metagenome]
MVIHFFQLAGNIARLPAQYVKNKGRGFVQRNGAGIRENNVFRTQRITGGEFRVGFQLDGQGLGCGIGFPAFGQNWGDFFRVIAVRLNQALIQAWHGLDTGKLVGFGRIETDDVIQTLGHHQRIGGRCGMGGCRQRGQHQ